MTTEQQLSSLVREQGAGEIFEMMGVRVTVKIGAAASGGRYTLLEQAVRPQSGSPPHICHGADKTIYVIEGEFAILAGERMVRATRGDMVFLPAGTPHNFKNVGAEEGRILVSLTPGGHEDFLRELAQLAADGKLSPATMAAVAQSHDVEMLTPRQTSPRA